MPDYEFRHPLRCFQFEAQDDEEAQEILITGFVVQPTAAQQTRLFRLADGVDITPTFAGRLASALHGSVADDPQFIAQELDPERLKQSKRELEAVFIQAWPAQTPGELKKGDRVERGSGATYEVGVVEEVGLRGAMITWDRGIKTWAARADLRVVPTCPHQGPTG